MNEENIMLLLLEKSGRARGQTRGASEDSSKKVLVSNCVEYTTYILSPSDVVNRYEIGPGHLSTSFNTPSSSDGNGFLSSPQPYK